MPVPPRHPAGAIPAVVDFIHGGKLIAVALGMAPLGAHQRDEVQGMQINLQELLQVIWIHWSLGAPGSITTL